jgi:hypothetical protein
MTSLFIIKDRRNSCNTLTPSRLAERLGWKFLQAREFVVNGNLNANSIDNRPRNAHIGLQLRRSRCVGATARLMARGKRNG